MPARTATLNVDVYDYWSGYDGEDVNCVAIEDANYDYLVNDCGSPAISQGSNKNYSFTAGQGQTYSFYAYDTDDNQAYSPFSPTLNSGTIIISDVDGNVNYYESGTALFPAALSLANTNTLHDLRFSNVGIGISGTANYSITNAQFVNCGIAMQTENSTLYAGNILMSSVGTGFYGQNFKGRVEQLTFDQGTHVTGDPAGTETGTIVALTNVLLTAVSDYGVVPVATNHVAKLSSATGIYKVVGAASHYLATNTYRNAGTAIINPSLLAALSQRTTYPPVVYTNASFRTVTNLAPQAARDNTGTPDYGYHYDPVDYAFSGSDLYTNMTIAAGTDIAYVEGSGGASAYFYGLSLTNGANMTFAGTATAPCWFVHNRAVMEGGHGNWTNRDWFLTGGMMLNGSNSPAMPQINAGFAKFVTVAGTVGPCGGNQADGVGHFMNCEFYNSGVGHNNWPSYYCTNCLFMRAGNYLFASKGAESFSCVNCTFFGGSLSYTRFSSLSPPVWLIKNTAFDGTAFGWSDYYHATNYTVFDYNVYNTNNLGWQVYPSGSLYGTTHGTNEIVGSHDFMVTNFNWQASWLGNFYLPTNSLLIDKGSTTADHLGLYHFTTQTNQVKETNSIVDIGYHYVSTDAYGSPVDTDGDGTPDYIADSNGNGIVDGGEQSWLLGIIYQPQSLNAIQGQNAVFSVIASGVAPFSYQWQFNGANIPGATGSTFTNFVVALASEGNYSVVVTNLNGSVTSANAALTVNVPLTITSGPTGQTVLQGTNASFSVGINGNYPVYQWFANGVPLNNGAHISGVTSSALTISNVTTSDAVNYSVTVANLFGSVGSQPAALTVITKPVVSLSPTNMTAIQSDDVTFNAAATGAGLSYQWWLTNALGTNSIFGATQGSYSKLVVQTNAAAHYSLIITKLAGRSNVNADLTVLVPPWDYPTARHRGDQPRGAM